MQLNELATLGPSADKASDILGDVGDIYPLMCTEWAVEEMIRQAAIDSECFYSVWLESRQAAAASIGATAYNHKSAYNQDIHFAIYRAADALQQEGK